VADILIAEQSAPSTPSSGNMILYPDSSNSQWFQKNDGGIYLGDQIAVITSQIASHSADTYYKGIQLPSFSMQAGSVFTWEFPVTKTAGTAAPVFTIRTGVNQSTADTSRLVITLGVQTAVVDTGHIKIIVTCRNVGASGILQGEVRLQHNLAATGFATTPAGLSIVQGTAAAFDNTALGGQYIGLSVNPGTSGAWVVEQCIATAVY